MTKWCNLIGEGGQQWKVTGVRGEFWIRVDRSRRSRDQESGESHEPEEPFRSCVNKTGTESGAHAHTGRSAQTSAGGRDFCPIPSLLPAPTHHPPLLHCSVRLRVCLCICERVRAPKFSCVRVSLSFFFKVPARLPGFFFDGLSNLPACMFDGQCVCVTLKGRCQTITINFMNGLKIPFFRVKIFSLFSLSLLSFFRH